ncbi:membrane bound O-acyl transferase family-domain-containing protein [Schizophyllum fasciatum]
MLDDHIPLDGHAALTVILPTYVLLFVEAALVQVPGTRKTRVAILPCGLFLLWRYASVDQTSLFAESLKSRLTYFNLGNITITLTLAMQLATHAVAPGPYYRTDSTPHKVNKSMTQLLRDAGDLMFNARGIGWKWGVSIPIPSFTTQRWRAIRWSALSFALHTVLVDIVLCIMYAINPALRAPEGTSMYEDDRGAPLSPLSTTAITFCMGTIIYAAVVYPYDLVRMVALLAGGDPARWPPLFDAPWAATSLADFWGRRWHQMFRYSFATLGAAPARELGRRLGGRWLGRVAGLFGAFTLSSVLHSWGLHGMGRGGDAFRISVFFLMMAVGISLEDAWRRWTGRGVGGLVGWLWTFGWLLGWGHFLVEAYCQKGIAGALWFRIVSFSVYGVPQTA